MLMLCTSQCKGCITGRSTHVNVMIHFRKVFENLESLGHIDTDDNTDLWALHSVYVLVINKRIDLFKEHHSHYSQSDIGHKVPHSDHLTSSLNNQVINSNIDPETMHHFSEWQNIPTISAHEPIVNPPFHIELINDQINHDQHLKINY